MKKKLTKKMLLVLDKMMLNRSMNQAIMESYDCKDIKSAYVLGSNLRKNELFVKELENRRGITKQILLASEGKKLTELIEEILPKVERARALAEIVKSGDKRSVLSALIELNKLEGLYPKESQRGISELEREREKVLTESDFVSLDKENKEKQEIKQAEEETIHD